MTIQRWIDLMLLVRTLLYIVAAYGFFTLATYFPIHETNGRRLMRRSCYALSTFFLLAGYKAATLFSHTSTVIADTLLTPALMFIVVLVYAGVIYLSRDKQYNGESNAHPLPDRDHAVTRS